MGQSCIKPFPLEPETPEPETPVEIEVSFLDQTPEQNCNVSKKENLLMAIALVLLGSTLPPFKDLLEWDLTRQVHPGKMECTFGEYSIRPSDSAEDLWLEEGATVKCRTMPDPDIRFREDAFEKKPFWGNVDRTKLDLQGRLGPVISDIEGVKAVAEAACAEGELETINVSGLDLPVKTLKGVIATREIALYTKGLKDLDAIIIAALIKDNGALETINLSGFDLPVKKLKGVDGTTYLDFDNKGLTNLDAIIIASLIKDNGPLTKLSLWSNSIGDVGAAAIAAALPFNGGLKELYVGFKVFVSNAGFTNGFVEEGALAIIRAELQRKKLTKLGLQQCSISDSLVTAIVELVQVSGGLTHLKLRGNSISEAGEQALRDAWATSGRDQFYLQL